MAAQLKKLAPALAALAVAAAAAYGLDLKSAVCGGAQAAPSAAAADAGAQ